MTSAIGQGGRSRSGGRFDSLRSAFGLPSVPPEIRRRNGAGTMASEGGEGETTSAAERGLARFAAFEGRATVGSAGAAHAALKIGMGRMIKIN